MRRYPVEQLRGIGFAANRRLLDVQTLSHDCAVGEDTWESVVRPITVGEQRASTLRFDDPRVQALLMVLVLFVLHTDGFRSADLREPMAQLLGIAPAQLTRGRMTYDLRRLRLHGLIERIPHTHRFRVTAHGLRIALFFSRTWARLLRPGLSLLAPTLPSHNRLSRAFDTLDAEIESFANAQRLVA